jgi:hypothetical protein
VPAVGYVLNLRPIEPARGPEPTRQKLPAGSVQFAVAVPPAGSVQLQFKNHDTIPFGVPLTIVD